MLTLKKGSALRVRYLIKFTKGAELKFLAHLDLMRTIQRVVRRTGLSAAYSKGFNPHMALSIAQPLPVGVYSLGDYLDVELMEEVEEERLIKLLNENSLPGIIFKSAVKVPEGEGKKIPQGMALLDAARYTLKLRYKGEEIVSELSTLMDKSELITEKKSKKGTKEVDIKPMIKDIKYWIKDDYLVINALLSCGSRENLSPELLAGYLKEKLPSADKEAFTEICREEMYALRENKLVNLITYVS
ncbi:TIGR03936 family radical SAM-associated protein [Alloiococcus sp. CFN-8]|uniref:TIGR03936 family radical SAM-associated protein n=1 Tax=Alloiococcus sp. CFN-8 TaxID=3416081 RepID=UPI003CEAA56A